MESSQAAAAKVVSLFIYPIKSYRGISVSEAPLDSTGLRWDRLWMVVNSKDRAYTQRVEPKLALVQGPGMDILKIPLAEPSDVTDGVSVWEWSGTALDEGNRASEWFSNYLGKPSGLVHFSQDMKERKFHSVKLEASETRPVIADHVRTYKVKFNDMYPSLLASQGSLDALNDRLKEPIPMNRFRPNILLDGCEPFSEDFWKEISINNLIFYAGEPCYRRKIPTINLETAIPPGSEPTETLRTFRLDKVLLLKHKQQGRVYFGQALVCKDSLTQGKAKTIKLGDPVYALKVVSSYD